MVVHLLVVRDHDAVVLVLQRCVVSLRPPKSRLHFDPPMATVFIRRPAVTESERENHQVEDFPLFAMAWAIPGQISNVHLNLWSCAIKISRKIQMEGFADSAVNVACVVVREFFILGRLLFLHAHFPPASSQGSGKFMVYTVHTWCMQKLWRYLPMFMIL